MLVGQPHKFTFPTALLWLPCQCLLPALQEDKYLKQIADLHFTVLRLKKQLQELGVETQDDSNSEGEV